MNDRPTPETDALRKSIDSGADAEAQMTAFAHKLEQERDEAREECHEQARLLGMGGSREAKLIRERDEAREEINRYREKLDLLPISWDV